MPWKIRNVILRGFKGINENELKLQLDERSCVIFAPNGYGKSSIADGIEYLFSTDGILKHLGGGKEDSEKGGKHAIPHLLTQETLPPKIDITLYNTNTKNIIEASRIFQDGYKDTIPNELIQIITESPSPHVIRYDDFHNFIADLKPGEKYIDFAKWFGQDKLTSLLATITSTRKKLSEIDYDREIDERLVSLREYASEINKKNFKEIIFRFCNSEIKKYLEGFEIELKDTNDIGLAVQQLQAKKDQSNPISLSSKRDTLQQKLQTISSDCAHILKNLNSLKHLNSLFEKSKSQFHLIEFKEFWKEAEKILTNIMIGCPLCKTPWELTEIKSREKAIENTQAELNKLFDFIDKQSKFESESKKFCKGVLSHTPILHDIEFLANELSISKLSSAVKIIVSKLEIMCDSAPLDLSEIDKIEEIISEVTKLEEENTAELKQIDIVDDIQDGKSLDTIIEKFKNIQWTLLRIHELNSLQEQFNQINDQFNEIAKFIATKIEKLVNNIISILENDIINTYKKIDDTNSISKILINFDVNDKTLKLRINFHDSSKNLPPAGYLSESRINLLGFSLFISAIKKFNQGFPFLLLDDIVSSYDLGHRIKLIEIIMNDLRGQQLMITTHDELFYRMLQCSLKRESWLFYRIKEWSFESGPRLSSDKIDDDSMEKIIELGDPKIAGNGLRQIIEEWFDNKCEEFSVPTIHKRNNQALNYTLSELYEPFFARMRKIKGNFYLDVIEEHHKKLDVCGILNFYSHSSKNQIYAMEDIKAIWTIFQEFKKKFLCYSCNRPLQYHLEEKKLFCTCGKNIFKIK